MKVGWLIPSTMFIVTPSEANYNLFLEHEGIHVIVFIPYTAHQMLITWDKLRNVDYLVSIGISFKIESTRNLNDEKILGDIGPCIIKTFKQCEEYCNINWNKVKIALKPEARLKVLSLKNTVIMGWKNKHDLPKLAIEISTFGVRPTY